MQSLMDLIRLRIFLWRWILKNGSKNTKYRHYGELDAP